MASFRVSPRLNRSKTMSGRSASAGESTSTTMLSRTQGQTSCGAAKLNTYQCRLLAISWTHLSKQGTGGLANMMFNKFLTSAQRQLLTKASVVSTFSMVNDEQTTPTDSLTAHCRALTELLDASVANLDDLDEVGRLCVEMGGAHATLKNEDFPADTWDKFGQTMLETLTKLEAVRKHKELVRAWMILISFIIDKLREGHVNASAASRRQRFQRSNTLNAPPSHHSSASVESCEFLC